MAVDVAAAIQKASAGLEYPSESDTPFDLVRWDAEQGDPTPDSVSKFAGRAKEKAKQVPVDEFFAALAETDDAAEFQKLEAVLTKNLSDLRVYRVGTPKVDIYILGKAASGAWLGLHTSSVET
jgi:Nuclease A inhibitor-like protein